jgi:hypothetical protein
VAHHVSGVDTTTWCHPKQSRTALGKRISLTAQSVRVTPLLQEQATNSQHASKAGAVEKLKHNLRQHGALQRLAALVAEAAAAPGGAVAASKQLHVLLLVLENATFTCPDNGSALAGLQIGAGGKGTEHVRG